MYTIHSFDIGTHIHGESECHNNTTYTSYFSAINLDRSVNKHTARWREFVRKLLEGWERNEKLKENPRKMVCSNICVCIIHKSIGGKVGKLWTFGNGGWVVEMPLNNIHMTFKMRTFRNLNKIINHATHPLHINCHCCFCYCCRFAHIFLFTPQGHLFICIVYLSRGKVYLVQAANE